MMSRLPLTLAALSALTGFQEPGQGLADRLRRDIADATAKLEEGRKEDASSILDRCRGLASSLEDAALEKRFMGEILVLARQSDPLAEKRIKLSRKVAKDLIDVAEVYTKRAWNRTALELLEKARALDPSLAKANIELLREKTAGSKKPEAESRDATGWLKEGDEPYSYTSGKWKVEGGEIRSPPPKNSISMLLADKQLRGSYRLAVDYKLAEPDGDAGLVFAFRDPDNFDVIQVMHDRRGIDVRLYEFEVRKRKTLFRHRIDVQPADWTRLSVEITDKEILVRVGESDTIRAGRRLPDYSGYPGLLIFGNTPGRKPTSFRKLRVEKR